MAFFSHHEKLLYISNGTLTEFFTINKHVELNPRQTGGIQEQITILHIPNTL